MRARLVWYGNNKAFRVVTSYGPAAGSDIGKRAHTRSTHLKRILGAHAGITHWERTKGANTGSTNWEPTMGAHAGSTH